MKLLMLISFLVLGLVSVSALKVISPYPIGGQNGGGSGGNVSESWVYQNFVPYSGASQTVDLNQHELKGVTKFYSWYGENFYWNHVLGTWQFDSPLSAPDYFSLAYVGKFVEDLSGGKGKLGSTAYYLYGNGGNITGVCHSDGTNCTGTGGGNPFNQVLNTTSNVSFNKLTVGNVGYTMLEEKNSTFVKYPVQTFYWDDARGPNGFNYLTSNQSGLTLTSSLDGASNFYANNLCYSNGVNCNVSTSVVLPNNWTSTSGVYIYNDSNTIRFNESKLNLTIDAELLRNPYNYTNKTNLSQFNNDAGYITAITGNLSQYAKLDGSNQPFTGNLNITKTNPMLSLVSSDETNYSATIDRSLTNQQFSIKNQMNSKANPTYITTKVNNTAPSVSDTSSTNGRIAAGNNGKGDAQGVYLGQPILDGSTYKVWYAGVTSGVDFSYSPNGLFYATSPDLSTWTKYNNTNPAASNTIGNFGQLPIGTGVVGDNRSISDATVLKVGNQYKMWYIGHSGIYTNGGRIYFANSSDGITWYKLNNSIEARSDTTGTQGRIPLGTTGKGDYGGDLDNVFGISGVSVILDGSTYKMWYAAGKNTYPSTSGIYYATSPDGLTWTKYNNVIESSSNTTGTNGRIPTGLAGSGDTIIHYVKVLKGTDGVYRAWYSSQSGGVYMATSNDGLTWTKMNNTIIAANDSTGSQGRIPFGTSGKADQYGTLVSGILPVGSSYYLFYTGRNSGGVATTGTFTTATMPSPEDSLTTVNVLTASKGINAGETGVIQLGSYTGGNGIRNIYEGLSHSFNILGTTQYTLNATGWFPSGSVFWISTNVSATGYNTRTSIYDKSKGTALDYIKDASAYLDKQGKINHSAFYGAVSYNMTDYSKPVLSVVKAKDGTQEVKTTYPYTYVEEGVSLDDEINLLTQAVYELKQQNSELKKQICEINKEYRFCQ